MNMKLMIAIIAITMALVFYTVGVFSERHAHVLKKWHVFIFWMGLVCDTTGTLTMSLIAKDNAGAGNPLHAVTGALAIVLMIFHAVWATVTLRGGDEKHMQNFHKFSLFVWLIWLIPYFIGMFIGMQ